MIPKEWDKYLVSIRELIAKDFCKGDRMAMAGDPEEILGNVLKWIEMKNHYKECDHDIGNAFMKIEGYMCMLCNGFIELDCGDCDEAIGDINKEIPKCSITGKKIYYPLERLKDCPKWENQPSTQRKPNVLNQAEEEK